MNNTRAQVPLSILTALLLMILPLPEWLAPYRPQWLALVVLFWLFFLPETLGPWLLLALGVVVDVLQVSVLGEHGFALLIMYACAVVFVKRFKFHSLLLQAVMVGFLIFIYQLIIILTEMSLGHLSSHAWFWLSTLMSMLLWPWLTTFFK